MNKEIKMKFEKTIRNTYKYLEITSDVPTLGTLYITKSVCEIKRPDMIKVILKW